MEVEVRDDDAQRTLLGWIEVPDFMVERACKVALPLRDGRHLLAEMGRGSAPWIECDRETIALFAEAVRFEPLGRYR